MKPLAVLKYLLSVLAMLPISSATARSAADVTGHYYLHGVREVGSELLLRPDGRYEWFLSYGASDTTSEGTWRLDGKQVKLTADIRPKKIALKLESMAAWNTSADEALRRQLMAAAQVQALLRCPFLGDNVSADSTTPPPFAMSTTERAAMMAQAKVDAAALLAKADAKRTALDQAIVIFLQQTQGTRGWQAASDQVATALSEFDDARRSAIDQYEGAEISNRPKSLDYFVPPSRCGVPDSDAFTTGAELHAAVQLGDPVTGIRLKGTTATFFFLDGTKTDNVAIIDGFAFVPVTATNPITAVEVQAEGARFEELGFNLGGTRFAVRVASPMIMPISFNADALMPRMFDTLTLTLSDGALTADMFKPGRYERDQ